jgi:AcrR family transcriptional regulator
MEPISSSPATTRQRILDAGRRLFNERGYAATPQAEIAAAVGISQGNLTYHFPTKRDLVDHLREADRARIRVRRSSLGAGPIADDYVEHLVFAMRLTRDYRFLLRDRAQFGEEPGAQRADAEMEADFAELRELLGRIEKDELFRRDLEIDLRVLARSLWIVGRYWTDYLRESEGLSRVSWADQERGIRHHFAVLLPYLTAPARREFEAALLRASVPLAAEEGRA